jgi:DnaJ-class molecular chaperone
VEYRTVSPDELESLFGDADPFSDFFHSMFGRSAGGGTRTRTRTRTPVPRRGDDLEATTEITLEEAYTGTTRTVELSGSGRTRRVEVSIPAGVADGARVRAAGQGGVGSGGDLLTKVDVPLDVALLGGEVAVPTLRGTTAQLRVAPGTKNGARLRLRGLGMPKLRGDGHGDLIAEIHVRLPETLSPAAQRLADELRAEREAAD